jgi:hypothetical protein
MERIGAVIPSILAGLHYPAEGGEVTVAPQAETEVVTGVIQGIIAKGADKWQVEVNTGQQNPRRLWTKDAALVGQLATMIGQQTSFLCGISHWTNQSGQAVRSLWINGVGQAAAVPTAAMPQQPVAPPPVAPQPPVQQPTVVQPMATPMAGMQQQPIMQQPMQQPVAHVEQRIPESLREARIMRQTASKVASILISHTPAEQRTLDNVLVLSERLVGYYEQGMAASNGGGINDPGPQGVPHTDDDIPF